MPYRYQPCCTEKIYHVFNRSVGRQCIFPRNSYYQRFHDLLPYYRFEKPFLRFSEFIRLPALARQEYCNRLVSQQPLVDILAFSIMPNHFHWLVRQKQDNGIMRFAAKVQNGYAKYFNIRQSRCGAVFQAMYKCAYIETDEQLLHVSRYIHLNHYSSGMVHSYASLARYPWSSFCIYAGNAPAEWVETETLLGRMGSKERLMQFTFDQADYQRHLSILSHLYHDEENM